ncbi:MAG TPA: S24 family peptidase [Candidatus Aphodomonas merdavium]|nr:S24 family peptidase [Candidatus Aphodomonas merdavium]
MSRSGITFNSTCVSRLDRMEGHDGQLEARRVQYVELLFNPVERMLAVRPCAPDDGNAIRWVDKNGKGRTISASAFCRVLFSVLGWDEGYVDAPEKADYALEIEGDSMEPDYLDGDTIYIRQQPDVYDGGVAVVLVDDSATLKRVYHLQDGLQLVSNNPKYPPMHVSFSEHSAIRILGIVVGYTRMYRSKT